MDDEAEIGFVESHAERRGGDEGLDPVGEQVGLGGLAVGVLGAAGVGGDPVAAGAQVGGDLLGGGDGEGVDDAGPRQLLQMSVEPGEPVGGVGQAQDGEPQALAFQRAAQYEGAAVGAAAGLQLFGDVGGDAGVGGRGGGQHRHPGGQLGQQGAQPPVVGTEVVPPVGDAVRLVDDQQAGGGGEFGKDVVTEVG